MKNSSEQTSCFLALTQMRYINYPYAQAPPLTLGFLRFSLLIALFIALSINGIEANESTRNTEVLSLEDAINMALENNRELRISGFGLENTKYSLESAESDFEVKIYPSMFVGVEGTGINTDKQYGGGLTFTKRFVYGTELSVSPSISQVSNQTTTGSLSFSLTQPLLRGVGKEITLNSINSAKHSLRSSERSYYLAKVNTLLATVNAFYNAGKYEMFIDLYKDLLINLEKHAYAAKAKEKSGVASQIDVIRAELAFTSFKSIFENTKETYQNNLDELKSVLSLPLDSSLTVVAPLKVNYAKVSEREVIKFALNNRVELKQMSGDIEEADRQLMIAKDALLPNLNLIASYQKDRRFSGLPSSNNIWSIQLETTTDFSRSREKIAYKQSQLSRETKVINAKSLKERIVQEARAQHRSLIKLQKNMKFDAEQINQAEGKLALAQIKFDHGKADNFDIITAEKEIVDSQIALINSTVAYILGTYRLRAVMGTLIEQ